MVRVGVGVHCEEGVAGDAVMMMLVKLMFGE